MRAKPSSNYGSDTEPGSANRTFSIGGHILNAPKPVPGLYLVATPIGNLGDITLRALETLAGVDAIACEDTRITRRLNQGYGISTLLTPHPEHNAALARPRLRKGLAQGPLTALVSDAGRPLVSVPGFQGRADTVGQRAGGPRRVRAGGRSACGGCAGHGAGRSRRAVALGVAAPQRQGRGRTGGRAIGPAAPRNLCPRARARQTASCR